MSDRMLVSTRKGLFRIVRGGGDAAGWEIEGTSFLGDPVTIALHDRRSARLYAALNLGHFGVKLRRSADDGATWDEIAVPAFPKRGNGDDAPSVGQIWALEAGGADRDGRLWAGTIPGALFRSDDGGDTWQLNEPLWNRPERQHWFGGGYDDPGIHSICVDPRDPERVAVGVSCGGVWLTPDGGTSWESRASGMFAAYMPPERRDDPAIQDPHRMVQCPADPDVFWAQHHNGVFRSTDGAVSWQEVPNVPPSVFGFAAAVHPLDPETAWLVPAVKDECRIPVDGRMCVARTRDGGASWETLRDGLPQEHAYDLVYRHALDVGEDGERLAMGSTTGSLWVSEDGGDSWAAVSRHLPPIYAVRFF